MTNTTQPYRNLYRSRTDKRIAGVCGGLGVYFRVDPLIIRLIFILFFLAGGAALIAYVLIWILVPFEPMDNSTMRVPAEEQDPR